MVTLHEISDSADPRLADYRDLRDVELRKHLEASHGLFLAEGEKVVRRAVEAGFAPRSFLMAPRWLDGLADVLDRSDVPCFVVSEALAEEVTGFHVHRGALASLQRRPLPTVESVLSGARTVLVLEDIVDHTNVGAILRSGAALGIDAVLLAPRCADPLYRRSINASCSVSASISFQSSDGYPDGDGAIRTNAVTWSGWASARSSARRPPRLFPTTTAGRASVCAVTAIRSARSSCGSAT